MRGFQPGATVDDAIAADHVESSRCKGLRFLGQTFSGRLSFSTIVELSDGLMNFTSTVVVFRTSA